MKFFEPFRVYIFAIQMLLILKNKQQSKQYSTNVKNNIPIAHKNEIIEKLWEKFYDPKSEDKRFRIRAKKFFLTYSQVPDRPEIFEEVRKCLENAFNDKRQKNMRYMLVRERHKGEGSHIHCYIEFDGMKCVYSRQQLHLKLNFTSSDLKKEIFTVFEGNYQSCKNKGACIQYMAKTLRNPRDLFTNIKRLPIFGDMYFDTMEEHLYHILSTKGLDAALDVLYRDYGEIAVKRGNAVEANLKCINKHFDRKRLQESISVLPMSDFKAVPDGVLKWMRQNKKQNKTVLVLYGPSGTGKTELAKAVCGKMGWSWLFVRHTDALKQLNSGSYNCVIFDDIDVSTSSEQELIHLYDSKDPSWINCKWSHAILYPETRRILTTNHLESLHRNLDQLKRRLTPVSIDKPLFKVKYEEEITTKKTKVEYIFDKDDVFDESAFIFDGSLATKNENRKSVDLNTKILNNLNDENKNRSTKNTSAKSVTKIQKNIKKRATKNTSAKSVAQSKRKGNKNNSKIEKRSTKNTSAKSVAKSKRKGNKNNGKIEKRATKNTSAKSVT